MSDSSDLLKFVSVDGGVLPAGYTPQALIDLLIETNPKEWFDDTFMINGCLAGIMVDECLVVQIDTKKEQVIAYKSPEETVKQFRALRQIAVMRDYINEMMAKYGLEDIW